MMKTRTSTHLSVPGVALLVSPLFALGAQVASASGAVTVADMPTDETRPQISCAKPYTDDRPCVMLYEYMHPSVDPDLRSERITIAGVVDTSNTTAPATKSDPERRPTLASMYDSETYLAVWEHTPPSGITELHSRLLDNDALPKSGGSSGTLVSSNRAARRPAVACAPTECLVVWEHEYSATDTDVYGLRVALDGSPLGSPFAIAASSRNEEMPALDAHVTEGDAAFYVAWQEEQPGSYDVFASFVTGGAAGPPLSVAASSKDETRPKIACRFGLTCMLAYELEYSAADHDVHGVVLGDLPDNSLTPTVPTTQRWQLASSWLDERTPDIDRDAIYDGTYTIVWERDIDANTSIIDVGRYDFDDGDPVSVSALAESQGPNAAPRRPAIAGSEWDHYLVTWQTPGVSASLDILAEPLVFP